MLWDRQVLGLSREAIASGIAKHGLEIDRDIDRQSERHLVQAVEHLRRSRPVFSAAHGLWRWQRTALILLALCVAAAVWLGHIDGLVTLLGIPFLLATAIKFLALWHGLRRHHVDPPKAVNMAEVLPRYSVLVPLFREPEVAPDLITALTALEYPVSQLEIFLILEASDQQTALALALCDVPAHFRIITVPAGEPQTKPRALNFALQSATGEYVVVYDAEDVPAPDQLRKAAAAFARAPETTCFQASLQIYNDRASWLTRQFSLEYLVLFDWVLPTLSRYGFPLPLGGTSNHFRREALIAAGAWDPFNVTEDADLGIRLARLGYTVDVLNSVTLEEAPQAFANWLPQRTRWLKGWMQTYAVHTRQPVQLWRDLSPRAFIGFHMLFGGIMLSALVHPLFYCAVVYEALVGDGFSIPQVGLSGAVWWIGVFNLIAGYAVSAVLAAVAALRNGQPHLIASLPLLPIYWVLISWAAYRALWQMIWRPFHWEKTSHTARDRNQVKVC